jgi:H+/Cl- antiporter ClcA
MRSGSRRRLGTSSSVSVVGAAIVVFARRLLLGDGGHPPLEGHAPHVTPVAYAPGIALAALGTLVFGAVLGPEAPVIALGAATALALTWFVRLGEHETTALAIAGSFSAVSALFGGPLVGGVLLVESGVGLGAALIPVLLPGFVAAAVGYLIFVGFGDWGGLDAPGLVVPDLPLYEGTHLLDLLVALAVGVATALVVAVIVRLPRRGDLPGHFPRYRARDAAGGLVRRLADARDRRRHGGGNGGGDPPPPHLDAVRNAARRNPGPRCRSRGGAGRGRGVADGDGLDRRNGPNPPFRDEPAGA